MKFKFDYPSRIICLTEETTEILYALGAGDKVVGVSAYTKRPIEARKKPSVSAFIQANYEKILSLKPDLVLAFSDLQADISKELVKLGVPVFTFNQRSVEEILSSILVIGGIIGRQAKAQELAEKTALNLELLKLETSKLKRKPKVYFEEWDEPMISGIRWVSEIIEIAGGIDIFAELRKGQSAKERFVTSEQVIERNPEIIFSCWCGKKYDGTIPNRNNWRKISALKNNKIFEVDPILMLQPGLASLTDGVKVLAKIIRENI